MVSPMSSSPAVVTSNSGNNAQQQLMQAMLQQLPQQQQQQIAAALALQARRMANAQYMRDSMRKLGPALTNGALTQAYTLGTPLTFNLNTALNGYVEGIVLRVTVNYTLAAGTSAVYGATAGGKLALVDNAVVVYNKTQAKFRPQVLRELAYMGIFDEWSLPYGTLPTGLNSDGGLTTYLDSGLGVAVGANTCTWEIFVPFNMIGPLDPRGVLPLMAGDTGIQVVVNTPLAIFGSDSISNAIYAVSGTGHAVSAVSGTVQVYAVYRDGDVGSQTDKLPFDITALEGTFQMQIDQTLSPLIAGQVQRTKLNIMGYHYIVVLLVVDAVQSNVYATDNNIVYLESAKDGIGGNVFWKYGLQTNTTYNDFLFTNRLQFNQDLSPGVIPMFSAPVYQGAGFRENSNGKNFLDNTRGAWADWRYGLQVTSVGALGNGPRIEPHVFYVNPVGLVAV